jgi:hypothetical protein
MRRLHKLGVEVKEEAVERAFRVFERQSEVDYFINKNGRAFLREQFRPLDVPKSLTRHSKQASMYTNGRCTIPRSVTCPTLTNTRRERLLPPID